MSSDHDINKAVYLVQCDIAAITFAAMFEMLTKYMSWSALISAELS